jgi:hypothetical protein
MSDTPRTDKYVLAGVQRSRHDMIEYAKKLERDLAARDAEIERLRGALQDRNVLWELLKYCADHEGECLGDHPVILHNARAAIAQPKEPT